jgi:hypothetical protein
MDILVIGLDEDGQRHPIRAMPDETWQVLIERDRAT